MSIPPGPTHSDSMKQRTIFTTIVALIFLAAVLAVTSRSGAKETGIAPPALEKNGPLAATHPASPAQATAESNPEREAYFGETHVHTSWSFDAYIYGNTKAGPEDAYKYALGQPIEHPAGYQVKITRPLDFMAVTDHAEYVGVVPMANDPNSPMSKLPMAEKLKVRSKEDMSACVLVSGYVHSQERADPGASQPRSGGQHLEAGCQHCGQVLPAGKVYDLRGL